MGMADRVGLVDVRILVTAILIQREVGGNLAEILDNLSYTDPGAVHDPAAAPGLHGPGPDERVRAGAAADRLGCVFYLLNPDYISILFTDPVGKFGLVVAVILQLIGFLWIRKIVDIEI